MPAPSGFFFVLKKSTQEYLHMKHQHAFISASSLVLLRNTTKPGESHRSLAPPHHYCRITTGQVQRQAMDRPQRFRGMATVPGCAAQSPESVFQRTESRLERRKCRIFSLMHLGDRVHWENNRISTYERSTNSHNREMRSLPPGGREADLPHHLLHWLRQPSRQAGIHERKPPVLHRRARKP